MWYWIIGIISIIIIYNVINAWVASNPKVYDRIYLATDYPKDALGGQISTKEFRKYLVGVLYNIEFPERPRKNRTYEIKGKTYKCLGIRLEFEDDGGMPISHNYPVLKEVQIKPIIKANKI